jgi:hypothetical protein
MSTRRHQPYDQMTAAELAEATKQYDQEFVGTPGKALTPAQKALHRRAMKRGRPRVGKGAQRINITVERGLLGRADGVAQRQGLTRAELVARALCREVGLKVPA